MHDRWGIRNDGVSLTVKPPRKEKDPSEASLPHPFPIRYDDKYLGGGQGSCQGLFVSSDPGSQFPLQWEFKNCLFWQTYVFHRYILRRPQIYKNVQNDILFKDWRGFF